MKPFLYFLLILFSLEIFAQNNSLNNFTENEKLLCKKWILISIIGDYIDKSQNGSIQIFKTDKSCYGILTGNCDSCFGTWQLTAKELTIDYVYYGKNGILKYEIWELNDSILKISLANTYDGYLHFKAEKN